MLAVLLKNSFKKKFFLRVLFVYTKSLLVTVTKWLQSVCIVQRVQKIKRKKDFETVT